MCRAAICAWSFLWALSNLPKLMTKTKLSKKNERDGKVEREDKFRNCARCWLIQYAQSKRLYGVTSRLPVILSAKSFLSHSSVVHSWVINNRMIHFSSPFVMKVECWRNLFGARQYMCKLDFKTYSLKTLEAFTDFSFYFSPTVGKTSLITRFMYDSFDNTYQVISTILIGWVLQISLRVGKLFSVAWRNNWD